MHTTVVLAVLVSLTMLPAGEERISTLQEIGPALTRCWTAPPGTRGHEVTVRFSLRRDGTLFGEPRITYSKLPGSEADARRFVGSVLASLAECLPLNITEDLGGVIAGRPIAIRFIADAMDDPLISGREQCRSFDEHAMHKAVSSNR